MTERRQSVGCLLVQKAHPLLRRGDSDDGGMGGFPAFAIGAGRLTQSQRISSHVQQVVLNLECQTDWSRKTGQRLVQKRIERG